MAIEASRTSAAAIGVPLVTRAEKRQQQRYRLARHPDGRVFLRSAGEECLIYGIRDVSNQGLSVQLDRALPVPSPVEIEYRAPKLALTLNGMVAWCKEHPDGEDSGYLLGVELFCPQILLVAFRDVLAVSAPEPVVPPVPVVEGESAHPPLEAPAR